MPKMKKEGRVMFLSRAPKIQIIALLATAILFPRMSLGGSLGPTQDTQNHATEPDESKTEEAPVTPNSSDLGAESVALSQLSHNIFDLLVCTEINDATTKRWYLMKFFEVFEAQIAKDGAHDAGFDAGELSNMLLTQYNALDEALPGTFEDTATKLGTLANEVYGTVSQAYLANATSKSQLPPLTNNLGGDNLAAYLRAIGNSPTHPNVVNTWNTTFSELETSLIALQNPNLCANAEESNPEKPGPLSAETRNLAALTTKVNDPVTEATNQAAAKVAAAATTPPVAAASPSATPSPSPAAPATPGTTATAPLPPLSLSKSAAEAFSALKDHPEIQKAVSEVIQAQDNATTPEAMSEAVEKRAKTFFDLSQKDELDDKIKNNLEIIEQSLKGETQAKKLIDPSTGALLNETLVEIENVEKEIADATNANEANVAIEKLQNIENSIKKAKMTIDAEVSMQKKLNEALTNNEEKQAGNKLVTDLEKTSQHLNRQLNQNNTKIIARLEQSLKKKQEEIESNKVEVYTANVGPAKNLAIENLNEASKAHANLSRRLEKLKNETDTPFATTKSHIETDALTKAPILPASSDVFSSPPPILTATAEMLKGRSKAEQEEAERFHRESEELRLLENYDFEKSKLEESKKKLSEYETALGNNKLLSTAITPQNVDGVNNSEKVSKLVNTQATPPEQYNAIEKAQSDIAILKQNIKVDQDRLNETQEDLKKHIPELDLTNDPRLAKLKSLQQKIDTHYENEAKRKSEIANEAQTKSSIAQTTKEAFNVAKAALNVARENKKGTGQLDRLQQEETLAQTHFTEANQAKKAAKKALENYKVQRFSFSEQIDQEIMGSSAGYTPGSALKNIAEDPPISIDVSQFGIRALDSMISDLNKAYNNKKNDSLRKNILELKSAAEKEKAKKQVLYDRLLQYNRKRSPQ